MVIKANVSSQLFFIFSNNHRFCYCLYSKLLMKKHLIISGRVQSVGFRYWLKKIAIERAVIKGEVSEERIDNSVKKILEMKGLTVV